MIRDILYFMTLLVTVICTATLTACTDDDPASEVSEPKTWHEVKVALVLPMTDGQDQNWEQTIELFQSNASTAFATLDDGIKLTFEWYDEDTDDMEALAEKLAARTDLACVIGGVWSSRASILVEPLVKAKKPFFTLATAEQFVRGYSSGGYLWAMTETDITQCEVLIAKAIYYGASSVALLADSDDPYGLTFTDWFPFQATEMGVENLGTFSDPAEAVACGAEYLICVASDTPMLMATLQAKEAREKQGLSVPRLLFSDSGYQADVLATVGDLGEGLEGVAYGADPQSGFDVTYELIFGSLPTSGCSQVYDACLLTLYASYWQLLHGSSTLEQALREVVTGEDKLPGSWMKIDMQLAARSYAAGGHPKISGASGSLEFDSRVFTNVLCTNYINYRIYNGKYIILDYNTTDGSKRSDATLAGWTWKASQMQDFDDTTLDYPELAENWAIVIAASQGYVNYRFQADALAMYQLLKANGYDDDHIILIIEDDLVSDERNAAQPGEIRNSANGDNLYHDLEIDYNLSKLTPDDFGNILAGKASESLPAVIEATANDNVLVFWSGHGAPEGLAWGNTTWPHASIRPYAEQATFRKMLWLVEACYSGNVGVALDGVPGLLCITAANTEETSKADNFSTELGVWMSNRFTITLLEQIEANPSIALRDLYYRLFLSTIGSHVTVYNEPEYGSLYTNTFAEFLMGDVS